MSSDDTFRNRIAEVAWASRPRPGGAAYRHGGMSTADAILALPEMQALLAKDDEIERLRAIGDALVGALENNLMATAVVLVNQWKEARHER